MVKCKVRAALCASCPDHLRYSEQESKVERGKILRFGGRYCTAGRHIREFGKGDPQQRVPKWCPKHKVPAILRIYCHRNSNTALLCHLMGRDNGGRAVILEYHYAMRFEGTTTLTAQTFEQRMKLEPLEELIGQKGRIHEIIEIDDGVSSYCFYIGDWWKVACIHFDAAQARGNILESASSTALEVVKP